MRSLEKLRGEELIPLSARIHTRLATEVATREELLVGLEHLLAGAGNASLMTRELRHALVDHAALQPLAELPLRPRDLNNPAPSPQTSTAPVYHGSCSSLHQIP